VCVWAVIALDLALCFAYRLAIIHWHRNTRGVCVCVCVCVCMRVYVSQALDKFLKRTIFLLKKSPFD